MKQSDSQNHYGRNLLLLVPTSLPQGMAWASQVLGSSFHACHDLRPRQVPGIQSLQCLLFWLPLVALRRHLFISLTRLYLFKGGAAPLYGPHDSLCTLTLCCFSSFVFLHNANTRYGWLTIPYPTGTLTLQEAPSFAWRTRHRFHRPRPN